VPGESPDALHAAVVASLRAFAPRGVAHVRGLIGTPVGRDAAGRVVERSKRGEAPRYESGGLSDSVQSDVSEGAGGASATLTLFSDAPQAAHLEFALDRPYFSTALTELAPELLDALARDVADALR
jgi:hypothetical protein